MHFQTISNEINNQNEKNNKMQKVVESKLKVK